MTDRDARSIVVGVDGNPAAHAAVAWAAEQARGLDRELVLLHGTEHGRATPFPANPSAGGRRRRDLVPYTDALGDTTTLSVLRQVVDGPRHVR